MKDNVSAKFKYDKILDFNDPNLDSLFIYAGIGVKTKSEEVGVYHHNKDILKIKSMQLSNIKESYFMMGLTLFSPGGINGLVGITAHNFHVRVSVGLGLDKSFHGSQFNCGIAFSKSERGDQNLTLGIGSTNMLVNGNNRTTSNIYESISYLSLSYTINYYGIFGEAGISLGDNTGIKINKANMIMQMGYVYQFK